MNLMQPPPRNIRTDIIVALAALSILVVGAVFAVVLTADTLRDTAEATAAVGTSTVESLAPTETAAIAQALPTATVPSTETDTPTPTVSPTHKATATPTRPAATATTAAQVAGADTPEPAASSTPSPRPTRTATLSATEPPPTPTRTATLSPTDTALPAPTRMPSATPTPGTPAAERTEAPSPTATILLATPITPSPSAPASTAVACTPPSGWQTYTIRSGDNLFRISLRAGVSLTQIQEANCITNPADIIAGTVIYVPASFYAGQPVEPGQPSPAATPAPDSGSAIPLQTGCTIPQVVISSPAPGATLTERFTVRGVATLAEGGLFSFYKVEIRREDQVIFRNISQSSVPAPGPDSNLATVNPADFGPGVYQLVLTVVDITGNYPEPCAIRVTFR